MKSGRRELSRELEDERLSPDGGEPIALDSLAFRPMELDDLEPILSIERESFPCPWSRKAFIKELTENPYAHYFVAGFEQRVIGYGGFWIIFDEAHVTTLAVAPACRRRSVGSRLLEQLQREAETIGARHLTLEVRESNRAAKKLYGGFGFREHGRRFRYYKDNQEDAVIMWKNIASR